ncbi:thymidilate synthase-like protein [Vibrio phage BONAISHI]|nr:thymidilate synthase-like protein [Vibrio phage BONAISHI]
MLNELKIHVLDCRDIEYFMRHGEMAKEPSHLGYVDALTPAMMGALKSRSAAGIMEDLKKIRDKGADHIIGQFFKKYGHASIGQNSGIVQIYIEGCSMQAAKAIQDFVFYNGQECSTRYIDFTEFTGVYPQTMTDEIKEAFDAAYGYAKNFYTDALEWKKEELKKEIPNYPSVFGNASDAKRDNIINAKAFDVCRSLLPTGARTMVAWHSLIETLTYRLPELMAHELEEVVYIAAALHKELRNKYPDAISQVNPEVLLYNQDNRQERESAEIQPIEDCILDTSLLTPNALGKLALARKMSKQRLSNHLKLEGVVRWSMNIDYGSWRDLQRHREIYTSEPILTATNGFHEWYYDELKDMPGFDARMKTMRHHINTVNKLVGRNTRTAAYVIPMGFKVSATIVCTLPQLVYIGELRSGHTVHPTARKAVLDMIDQLTEKTKETFRELDPSFNFNAFLQFNFTTDAPRLFYAKRGDQNFDEILK